MIRCYLIFLVCLISTATAAEDNAQKAAELESLRTRIKDVESNIQAARSETDQIYQELQENEIAAAAVSQKLADIDKDINNSVQSLAELNVKQTVMQGTLAEERA